MELETLGIDLGKTSFYLGGLDLVGSIVVLKRMSRSQLLRFTSNLRVGLIDMEACGVAHFFRRALQQQGHKVRLMPAICEAVCEDEQERLHRCGSDHRSCHKTNDAVLPHQDR